jgi:acyl carrier protein phosphodiesterase
MADGIRGKQFKNYPVDVQKELSFIAPLILLLMPIPFFRQSTKKLHSRYHHYAGVIVDVFTIIFWRKIVTYSNENLSDFILLSTNL